MISLGLDKHGPEGNPFSAAWSRSSISFRKTRETERWRNREWGVNLVFHTPGSVLPMFHTRHLQAERFSRKQKLLLIEAIAPEAIIEDEGRSLKFILQCVRDAIPIAMAAFRKKKVEEFAEDEAIALIDAVEQKLRD